MNMLKNFLSNQCLSSFPISHIGVLSYAQKFNFASSVLILTNIIRSFFSLIEHMTIVIKHSFELRRLLITLFSTPMNQIFFSGAVVGFYGSLIHIKHRRFNQAWLIILLLITIWTLNEQPSTTINDKTILIFSSSI